MDKKYEFTGETKEHEGRTLHRIRRIKDGLVGGWIESEFNLSHKDNCFIYDNAMVFGNARIYGYAEIFCDARVCGDVVIYGYARVFGNAKIYGDAEICDNARIYGNAMIYSNAEVCGNVRVCKGRIIGQISQPYKDIFQYQCERRVLTAILTEDDKILYSIGCQYNITKEVFLDRIYNEDGGLKENPHREEYLKLIPSIEQYFKN